jgi:hypothetical protein
MTSPVIIVQVLWVVFAAGIAPDLQVVLIERVVPSLEVTLWAIVAQRLQGT